MAFVVPRGITSWNGYLAALGVAEEAVNTAHVAGGLPTTTRTESVGPCMFCQTPLVEKLVTYQRPLPGGDDKVFRWVDENDAPQCPELERRGQTAAPFHQPWFVYPDESERHPEVVAP